MHNDTMGIQMFRTMSIEEVRSVQSWMLCLFKNLQQGLGDDIVGESESSAGHGGHVTVTLVLGEQRQAGSRGSLARQSR